MKKYNYTEYFEKEVLRKRPYLKKEWCIGVIENPLRVEAQEHNRYRFWGTVEELGDRILRVVTLSDRTAITLFPTGGIKMKLNYYPETDSLYIDLSEKKSAESKEISEGVVLDYDAEGNLVGIDIDNASTKIQLKELILSRLPSNVHTVAA